MDLIEDHALIRLADDAGSPMPWQPSEIDDVLDARSDGTDIIAARFQVT